jgi:hypothetical protein
MRRSAVDRRTAIPTCFLRFDSARRSSYAIVLLAATLAAGCAQRETQLASAGDLPLPEKALLAPQPEPDCRFKGDAKADERQRLDYEQQCYRQAEMIVHERLRRLQRSVARTIAALNRSDDH